MRIKISTIYLLVILGTFSMKMSAVFAATFSLGDLNSDFNVNLEDLNILKADFGKDTASLQNSNSDINKDGLANIEDVGIIMSRWKTTPEAVLGTGGYGPDLAGAVAAIGSKNIILDVPAGNWNITKNTTMPENISVKMEDGALFTITNGIQLTFNGPFIAGKTKVFDDKNMTGTTVLGTHFSALEGRYAYPDWWGALPNDSNDDSMSIKWALNAMQGTGKLIIPAGTYKSMNQITIKLTGDLDMEGESGAVVDVEGNLQIVGAEAAGTTLSATADRKSKTIQVADASGIQAGDMVHIQSDQPGTTTVGWKGYNKNDMNIAAADSSGTTVSLTYPLNFTYTQGFDNTTVAVYHPHKVTMSNLELYTPISNSVVISGTRQSSFNNLKIKGGGKDAYGTYLSGVSLGIFNDADTSMKNTTIEDAQYGVSIARSRNFTAENTVSKNCWVPFAPSIFTDTVEINGLTGENNVSTMDAHDSINTNYENVVAHDTGGENLRSIGGSVKNSSFYISGTKGDASFNNVFLSDPTIYNDYDFTAENVIWETPNAPDGQLAFGPTRGRNAYLKNVTAKNLYMGDINKDGTPLITGSAVIEDCRYNYLSGRNASTIIRSTKYPNLNAAWDSENNVYTINPRSASNYRTYDHENVQGSVFVKDTPDPMTKRVRLYTYVPFYTGGGSPYGISYGMLKLKAVDLNNTKNVLLEKTYSYSQQSSTGDHKGNINTAPVSVSGPFGAENGTLDIHVDNPTYFYDTSAEFWGKWYIEFDVTLNPGNTNPTFALDYDLAAYASPYNVQTSNITSNSATITWSTGEPGRTQVLYGTTASYGSQTDADSTYALDHSVNLTGLSAGTTYHYQTKSINKLSGNWEVSKDFTFSTP